MVLTSAATQTDALVIGAGPVGLFQVFQLGLQEIRTHVIDVLPHIGGQCMALYADKPIYDIPGIPRCTGRELTERLEQQIAPFKPVFHLQQLVSQLHQLDDKRWQLSTSNGAVFITKTLFIAAGVGAFSPRKPPLPELDTLEGKQVFYSAPTSDLIQGKRLVVLGADDEALQAALDGLAQGAASVHLIHRRETLEASQALQNTFKQTLEQGRLHFVVAQIKSTGIQNGLLSHLNMINAHGAETALACDVLMIKLGLTPQLGPIANWSLDFSRKQIQVNTENFSTTAAGIFAVGDINTYPGKRKLILSGFHEATLAAYGAAAYLRPTEKIPLEYTTASPRLHRLLGV
jgi:thioredoxin reductase (NADPH)